MQNKILVFYGSYRSDRAGIRLANYIVSGLCSRGADAELIDAKVIGLPILDRMYKEFAPGTAPSAMEELAAKIKAADAFVFVTGEYNWGMQPGLKNLTDHFLEEWFWRPAAIASYSAGKLSGARASVVWHGTLSEMGMVVIPAHSPWVRSARHLMLTANRSVRLGQHCSKCSLGLRTIWPGGPRPPKRNASESRPHTDEPLPGHMQLHYRPHTALRQRPLWGRWRPYRRVCEGRSSDESRRHLRWYRRAESQAARCLQLGSSG